MKKDFYKIKMVVEDITGEVSYGVVKHGDSPTTEDFLNFCYEAATAYGFTESQVRAMFNTDY